jgi:hypothetical protein
MNKKDDEIAHSWHAIKTLKAPDFGPIYQFAMDKSVYVFFSPLRGRSRASSVRRNADPAP